MIVVVGSNKGGVAKSTTTCNLAIEAASRGYDVVLVDADLQGSCAKWNDRREEGQLSPSIMVVQKYGNLVETLRHLDQKYDIVFVDVAGRNSREFISGGSVANIIIAPHQASQFDLESVDELTDQVIAMRDRNPDLKVYIYQVMMTTNPVIAGSERNDFLEYFEGSEEFIIAESASSFRKIYRDTLPTGTSVLEAKNEKAISEVRSLFNEVIEKEIEEMRLTGGDNVNNG